MKLDITVRR